MKPKQQLSYQNDLNAADWSPLGGNRPGTGASLIITDTLGTSPQRFYRIALLP
jgi:hypothetical protein